VVDIEAAIGFVVARGDRVDRARLSWLRNGTAPHPGLLDAVEAGQTPDGGWPAILDDAVPSVDATCFRLGELDDLGAIGRSAGRKAMDWLAARQRADGTWEEDSALADVAPEWARPGDPEAQLYLTANAAYWIAVAGLGARSSGPLDDRVGGAYAGVVQGAAQALAAAIEPDGSWPSYLATGWLSAAVLHGQGMYLESARIQGVLGDRLPEMAAADAAWLAATFSRVSMAPGNRVLQAALDRLGETQRSDGGWDSADGEQFDVHTTLAAIRACLPARTPAG